jgi:hypothetical protein
VRRASRPAPLTPPISAEIAVSVAKVPDGFIALPHLLAWLYYGLPDQASIDEDVDSKEPLRAALLANECQAFVLRANGAQDPINPEKWKDEFFIEAAFSGWHEKGAGTVIVTKNALQYVGAARDAAAQLSGTGTAAQLSPTLKLSPFMVLMIEWAKEHHDRLDDPRYTTMRAVKKWLEKRKDRFPEVKWSNTLIHNMASLVRPIARRGGGLTKSEAKPPEK